MRPASGPDLFTLALIGEVAEQVIRPTGVLDPVVEVRPTTGQVDDLHGEIRDRVAKNQRVLVTTLTKRMAEDLTDYLAENEVRVRYPHSEIHSIERIEIIQDLRLGEYDVLVGVVGKAAKALENDPDAGLALEALPELIDQLEAKMKEAAKKLDFEEAANCAIG